MFNGKLNSKTASAINQLRDTMVNIKESQDKKIEETATAIRLQIIDIAKHLGLDIRYDEQAQRQMWKKPAGGIGSLSASELQYSNGYWSNFLSSLMNRISSLERELGYEWDNSGHHTKIKKARK